MHFISSKFDRGKGHYVLLALNAFLWVNADLWMYVGLVWLATLAALIRQSRITVRQIGVAMATSPLFVAVCMFGYGTVQYWTGTATSLGGGWSSIVVHEGNDRFTPMDRETRLPTRPYPCMPMDGDRFSKTPTQSAIDWNTRLFGYASNAWLGPFPEEDELPELLERGDRVPGHELSNHGVGEKLKQSLFSQHLLGPRQDWIVVELDERTLLVHHLPPFDSGSWDEVVFLLDLRGQRIVTGFMVPER